MDMDGSHEHLDRCCSLYAKDFQVDRLEEEDFTLSLTKDGFLGVNKNQFEVAAFGLEEDCSNIQLCTTKSMNQCSPKKVVTNNYVAPKTVDVSQNETSIAAFGLEEDCSSIPLSKSTNPRAPKEAVTNNYVSPVTADVSQNETKVDKRVYFKRHELKVLTNIEFPQSYIEMVECGFTDDQGTQHLPDADLAHRLKHITREESEYLMKTLNYALTYSEVHILLGPSKYVVAKKRIESLVKEAISYHGNPYSVADLREAYEDIDMITADGLSCTCSVKLRHPSEHWTLLFKVSLNDLLRRDRKIIGLRLFKSA